MFSFATITLTPPWEGSSAPTFDMKDIHIESYWEGFFAHILEPFFTLFTENIAWFVLAITLILVPAFGLAIWRLYSATPMGSANSAYTRAHEAQLQGEIDENS